jgi:uncharacterized protein
MIGTFVNCIAIVIGGGIGMIRAKEISPVNQQRIQLALAAFIIYAGLTLVWRSLHGPLLDILKQLFIVLLALIIGNMTGKFLGLQRRLNRLGQFAREKITNPASAGEKRLSHGFLACAIVYCLTPIAVLGAMEDGLTGSFKALAVKSVMDGLAAMAFVKIFGWPVLLSALPVLAFQGTITLLAFFLMPFLEAGALLDSVTATAGLLIFCVCLIILGLQKIRLADYLPSLLFAPLITWIWP